MKNPKYQAQTKTALGTITEWDASESLYKIESPTNVFFLTEKEVEEVVYPILTDEEILEYESLLKLREGGTLIDYLNQRISTSDNALQAYYKGGYNSLSALQLINPKKYLWKFLRKNPLILSKLDSDPEAELVISKIFSSDEVYDLKKTEAFILESVTDIEAGIWLRLFDRHKNYNNGSLDK